MHQTFVNYFMNDVINRPTLYMHLKINCAVIFRSSRRSHLGHSEPHQFKHVWLDMNIAGLLFQVWPRMGHKFSHPPRKQSFTSQEATFHLPTCQEATFHLPTCQEATFHLHGHRLIRMEMWTLTISLWEMGLSTSKLKDLLINQYFWFP